MPPSTTPGPTGPAPGSSTACPRRVLDCVLLNASDGWTILYLTHDQRSPRKICGCHMQTFPSHQSPWTCQLGSHDIQKVQNHVGWGGRGTYIEIRVIPPKIYLLPSRAGVESLQHSQAVSMHAIKTEGLSSAALD